MPETNLPSLKYDFCVAVKYIMGRKADSKVKERIILMSLVTTNKSEIAKKLKVSRNCVLQTIRAHEETGSVSKAYYLLVGKMMCHNIRKSCEYDKYQPI